MAVAKGFLCAVSMQECVVAEHTRSWLYTMKYTDFGFSTCPILPTAAPLSRELPPASEAAL